MKPALVVDGIEFFDAPSEIEGSPFWVDLWADVNGYKIGLQVKPTTYKSASVSIYTGMAKSSEEKGHKEFTRRFGGKVFIVSPNKGSVSLKDASKIRAEYELLKQMIPKE